MAVQTLAGVLLPSCTLFLLLLCNDRAVLGPWVNGRWLNLFTASVVGLLVMMSFVLIAAVLFPAATERYVVGFMGTCLAAWAVVVTAGVGLALRVPKAPPVMSRARRAAWRMQPLAQLPGAELSRGGRVSIRLLWGYLLVAVAMVVVRVVQLASG